MLHVHLATDGDSASITPRPNGRGGAADPLRTALETLVADIAVIDRGPTEDAAATTDVLIGSRITAERLRGLPRLRAVVVPWAGVPRALVDAVAASGLTDLRIRNIHHNAASAAETAVALLLSAARGVHRLDPLLRVGDWRPRYEPRPSRRLAGGRATVLGRGAIGGRIARALDGLDMRTRTLGRPPRGDRWTREELADAVRGSDVLVAAVPALPETERLLDGPVLDAMPGAIVVNVGRASVLDEAALHDRLADGRLFAAGLDVWWRVPATTDERRATPPSDLPFHDLDNVVMTPHVGGGLGEPGIESARAEALAEVVRELATTG